MFPAAMLGLTMLVTLGMVAVSPPPPITEETRAKAAAEAIINAHAAALKHCRATTCPVGEITIPGAARQITRNVLIRRQSDGTIIAYWHGGNDGENQTTRNQTVSPARVNIALQQEAKRLRMNTERLGPAERVSQALGGSLQGNSGNLIPLGGVNVPRNMPVLAVRG